MFRVAVKFTRKQIDELTELARKNGAGGLAYILYENGTVRSPIAKFLKRKNSRKSKI